MTLRETYTALFPAPVARRMIEQTAHNLHSSLIDTPNGYIQGFGDWETSREGFYFWNELDQLYDLTELLTPTEAQVKEVFATHQIPYE